MSVAENPLTGAMRNSMANFTKYRLNGMNIVRSKAFKIKDPMSDKQLRMRARMTLMAKMYKKFTPIIALGFPERDVRKSPQNMFVSVNFTTAFVMEENVPVISYPLMLLAKGSLPCVSITETGIDAEGISINYDAGALCPKVEASNEIIACAMLQTGGLLMTRQFIGISPIGTIHLTYPSLQAEQVACCYVFIRSNDGMKTSDSVYVEVNS
jgi:hypothetical protein